MTSPPGGKPARPVTVVLAVAVDPRGWGCVQGWLVLAFSTEVEVRAGLAGATVKAWQDPVAGR